MLRLMSGRELIVSWLAVEADAAMLRLMSGKKMIVGWLVVEAGANAEADVGKKGDCWLASCRG